MKGKKDKPGAIGRRTFIAGAGSFAAVTTFGVATPQTAQASTACRVLLHDAARCVGCGVCTMMCSLSREGESGPVLSRSVILRDPFEYNFTFSACKQCRAPSCYFACPLAGRARCIDEDSGLVYVDASSCIGCGRCVDACPFDPPGTTMHPTKRVAMNCDRCYDRTDGPVCTRYCTMGALSCVSMHPPRWGRGRIGV